MAGTREEPTRADLDAVLAFARRFDKPDFVAGTWSSPAEDGSLQFGYWTQSEDVSRWYRALYEHNLVFVFEWMEPAWSERMERFRDNPELLKTADLLTIRKVLTALLRADRFCDGYLAGAFDRGVPQAAMRRLRVLCRHYP